MRPTAALLLISFAHLSIATSVSADLFDTTRRLQDGCDDDCSACCPCDGTTPCGEACRDRDMCLERSNGCVEDFCTSDGNDCCVGAGEPQTCSNGYVPQYVGAGCFFDLGRSYTCCPAGVTLNVGNDGKTSGGSGSGGSDPGYEYCNRLHGSGGSTCCEGGDVDCNYMYERRELRELREGRELGHCCDAAAYCACRAGETSNPTPSQVTVNFALVASGSVSDYADAGLQAWMRSDIAIAANVNVSQVSLEIASASVSVQVQIEVDSYAEGLAAEGLLAPRLTDPATATALFTSGAVSVESIAVRPSVSQSGSNSGATCSQAFCTSPTADGDPRPNDCWAGTAFEACTCSQGEAKTTGNEIEYDGSTYYEYTCCTDGDGEVCGDFIGHWFWAVLISVAVTILICSAIGIYCCCKRGCCRGCCGPPQQTRPQAHPSGMQMGTSAAAVASSSHGVMPVAVAHAMPMRQPASPDNPPMAMAVAVARPMDAPKFCTHCGTAVVGGDKFCGQCGAGVP